MICLWRVKVSSNNQEWLISFRDNSFFRISETDFFKEVHTNKKLKKGFPDEDRGMCEMDFCYLNDSSIDLIECKELSNLESNNRSLKENCTDKALHSVSFIKTALYSKNESIVKILHSLNKNYDANIELKLYFVFKISSKDKNFIDAISKKIEQSIRKFVLFPLGEMYNSSIVEVLDYDTAKIKLGYIL